MGFTDFIAHPIDSTSAAFSSGLSSLDHEYEKAKTGVVDWVLSTPSNAPANRNEFEKLLSENAKLYAESRTKIRALPTAKTLQDQVKLLEDPKAPVLARFLAGKAVDQATASSVAHPLAPTVPLHTVQRSLEFQGEANIRAFNQKVSDKKDRKVTPTDVRQREYAQLEFGLRQIDFEMEVLKAGEADKQNEATYKRLRNLVTGADSKKPFDPTAQLAKLEVERQAVTDALEFGAKTGVGRRVSELTTNTGSLLPGTQAMIRKESFETFKEWITKHPDASFVDEHQRKLTELKAFAAQHKSPKQEDQAAILTKYRELFPETTKDTFTRAPSGIPKINEEATAAREVQSWADAELQKVALAKAYTTPSTPAVAAASTTTPTAASVAPLVSDLASASPVTAVPTPTITPTLSTPTAASPSTQPTIGADTMSKKEKPSLDEQALSSFRTGGFDSLSAKKLVADLRRQKLPDPAEIQPETQALIERERQGLQTYLMSDPATADKALGYKYLERINSSVEASQKSPTLPELQVLQHALEERLQPEQRKSVFQPPTASPDLDKKMSEMRKRRDLAEHNLKELSRVEESLSDTNPKNSASKRIQDAAGAQHFQVTPEEVSQLKTKMSDSVKFMQMIYGGMKDAASASLAQGDALSATATTRFQLTAKVPAPSSAPVIPDAGPTSIEALKSGGAGPVASAAAEAPSTPLPELQLQSTSVDDVSKDRAPAAAR